VTPEPGVTPVGFAATDAPDAPLRHRRNPVWLALAIVLVAAGVAGIVLFVAEQLEHAPGPDEAVAAGQVAALDGPATPPVRFHGEGAYTVWLEVGGERSDVRDTIVAAVNCTANFDDGRGTVAFRGARQGAAVTIGDRSTVGTFDAPGGAVEVTCRQEPFGRLRTRDRLRSERPYFVTAGKPGASASYWFGMFGGIAALCLAPWALGRWRAGTLRSRSG
jgi:hypothetical protein